MEAKLLSWSKLCLSMRKFKSMISEFDAVLSVD